jgi:biotin carboxyl carrier protein
MTQVQPTPHVTEPPVRIPLPPVRPRRTPWWRRRRVLIVAVVIALLGVIGVAVLATRPSASGPTSATDPAAVAPRLTARGVVRPLAQSRVGTVSGGVLDRLSVAVGDRVPAAAELGLVRPRSDAPVEVLTAPRAGTVTSVSASVGDTLAPGAVVTVIADLSRLQVETTDLDEFLVSRVFPGQRVTINVPALDNRQLRGIVRTVGLQPDGDSYPAVIDITDAIPPDLRVGMGVRLAFDER